jgi:hypothetical protein
MSGFQSVYKRHTPFSISSIEYVGNNITLDKVGDVLLYAYLFSDGSFFDWTTIESVDMYIGGQLICSWDPKYITTFYPFLSSTTFTKSSYDDTLSFLPIPVPMLPLKNMRYHQCEFKIVWRRAPQVLKFVAVYAFVDEDIPDCDLLIQKVKKLNIRENEPVRLNGLLKYMVSDTLTQPTVINLDGQDVHIAPIDVYRYHHTKHGDIRDRYFKFVNLDLGMPRTCQRINDKIFIFSSLKPIVYLYDTDTYYGSDTNYIQIHTGFTGVLSSCTDGSLVYASTTEGDLFSIDSNGTFTNLNVKVDHEVYGMHYFRNKVYMIGLKNITVFDGNRISEKIGLYGEHNGSFVDEQNRLVLFRSEGNKITVFYENNVTSELDFLSELEYGSQLFNLYNQFSSSIVVNGVTYIASGYNNIFQVGSDVYNIPRQEQEYMTLVYDGKNAVFVFGYNSIFRYSIVKYNMFVPFCLDVNSSESTGYLNTNMIREVKFTGTGNGVLYTVNYNFLRIQNGMTGILYAH